MYPVRLWKGSTQLRAPLVAQLSLLRVPCAEACTISAAVAQHRCSSRRFEPTKCPLRGLTNTPAAACHATTQACMRRAEMGVQTLAPITDAPQHTCRQHICAAPEHAVAVCTHSCPALNMVSRRIWQLDLAGRDSQKLTFSRAVMDLFRNSYKASTAGAAQVPAHRPLTAEGTPITALQPWVRSHRWLVSMA